MSHWTRLPDSIREDPDRCPARTHLDGREPSETELIQVQDELWYAIPNGVAVSSLTNQLKSVGIED
jgi:hypothetical protein